MLLGVNDMDIFKGIGLKLLAMEQLLKHILSRGEKWYWCILQILQGARERMSRINIK